VRCTTDETATVTVKDPSFALRLRRKLEADGSQLHMTEKQIAPKHRLTYKKVQLSWHKSTRRVWCNFERKEVARRVVQKFNEEIYTYYGRPLEVPLLGLDGNEGNVQANPAGYTIAFTAPAETTREAIQFSITSPGDRPRAVNLGRPTCEASIAQVAAEANALLRPYGTLTRARLVPPHPTSRRDKLLVWFEDEIEARAAAKSLNNRLCPS
jgi:hypothetical protein